MHYGILLTQNCNLSCWYCYEQYRSPNQSMDNETLNATLQFIKNDLKQRQFDNEKEIRFTITGGEPLLSFYHVKESIKRIREISYQFEIVVASNLILADDEILEFFVSNNISLFVGYDGKISENEKKYPGKSKSDYIDQINEKIRKLYYDYKYKNLIPNIVLTPRNLSILLENIEFLMDTYPALDISIRLAYNDDWTEENLNQFSILMKNLLERYYEIVIRDQEFKISFIDGQVLKCVYPRKYSSLSCGAGIEELQVLTDGRIISCNSYSYESEEMLEVIIGDVHSGISKKNLKDYRSRIMDINFKTCKSCPLQNKCNNVCTANNLLVNSNLHEIPDSVCNLNQIFIVEVEKYIDKLYTKNHDIFKIKYLRE